jgi:hypothetical protein
LDLTNLILDDDYYEDGESSPRKSFYNDQTTITVQQNQCKVTGKELFNKLAKYCIHITDVKVIDNLADDRDS